MDNDLIISEVDNNLLPDNSECMGLLSSKSYTTNSVLYSIIGCLLIIFVLLVLTGPVDTWLTVKFGDLPSKSLLRCWDSLLHGCIGGVSWLLVICTCPELTVSAHGCTAAKHTILALDAVAAFAIAFLVDVDHIIPDVMACIQGSESRPWQRGIFHFSFPVVMATIFITFYYIYTLQFSSESLQSHGVIPSAAPLLPLLPITLSLTLLAFVSIMSHHIRDGVHHGLWLQPLVVTSRMTNTEYQVATVLLPLLTASFISYWCQQVNKPNSLHSVIDV